MQNSPVSSQRGITTGEVRRVIQVSKHHHPSSIYPSLSSLANKDLANLLQRLGFKEFYSCLNWHVDHSRNATDFLMSSDLVHKENGESEIFYIAPHCHFPVVITVEKLAQVFQLSLDGMDDTPAVPSEAKIDIYKEETYFKLDTARRYYILRTGISTELCTAGKFARQALFLIQNRSIMGRTQMKILTAAVEGKPVAWERILWKNLVMRMSSFHKLASRCGSQSQQELSSKLSSISYGAVVVALLTKLEQKPEPNSSPNVFTNSLDKDSDTDSDEETLINMIQKRRRKKARLMIGEDSDAEEDGGSRSFALYGCERTGEIEDRWKGVHPLGQVAIQIIPGNVLVKEEEVSIEEEISIGEPSADWPLVDASNSRVDAAAGLDGGDAAEFTPNLLQLDHSREVILRVSNDCHLALEPHFLHGPNELTEWPLMSVNVDHGQIIEICNEDNLLEIRQALSNKTLKVSAAEPEEVRTCGMDLIEKPDVTKDKSAEMAHDRFPSIVSCYTNPEPRNVLPKLLTMSYHREGQSSMHQGERSLIRFPPLTARVSQKANPLRLMTDKAQIPATSLVKMVISVRHFLDGLNEAGVPPEVYVKSKAGRLMDALKLELENRDLEDFDEQTHLFGMNQTVDNVRNHSS
ncbi:hypothetical protein R1flu_026224 [Riccia fluitans]|uniref:Uncharacterized protein n=1 Tax=Riccia fluitans TaxID=41844 RepID=A0ABD1XIA7_9MARC